MQINCLACYLLLINIKCTIDHSKCKISLKDGGLLYRFHICCRERNPMDCSLPASSVYGFPRRNTGMHYHSLSPGDLHDKGIEPRDLLYCSQILYPLSQHLQVLWEVFLTQALNFVFFAISVSETPACPLTYGLTWLCPYCSYVIVSTQ